MPRRCAWRAVSQSKQRWSISSVPRRGRTVPLMIIPREDLPAPCSPTTACTVPARSVRLTSRSASTWPYSSDTCSRRSSSSGVEPILHHLGVQGLAAHVEDLRRPRAVVLGALEDLQDQRPLHVLAD